MWITFLTFCSLLKVSASGLRLCTFPESWRGSWYQSGVGQVVISEISISNKGNCLERHRDYYLIQNRNEHCHQCLIILHRHHNLIQYKESFCIGRSSLQSICALIQIEAVLLTLVREPAHPIPCPFLPAYHFTYNNHSGGSCRSPMSYVHQCASPTMFRFGFRSCQMAGFTEDKDMELQCLASWKQKSGLFLYGSIAIDGGRHRDNMYKCIMYELHGAVGYLSMSANGSCSPLRGTREGATVIDLVQDNYGWPQSKCSFPHWMAHDVWRDLASKHIYHIEDPSGEILHVSYKAHHEKHPVVLRAYHCINLNEENTTSGLQLTVLTFTLEQCVKQYECIRIIRRQPTVLEFQRGDTVISTHGVCTGDDLKTTFKHLLMPQIMSERPCPFQGLYASSSEVISRCRVQLSAGCKQKRRMEITSSCFSRPIAQFECVQWWAEGGKQYVIVRKWKHSEGIANCYSFRKIDGDILFGLDPGCNYHVGTIARQQVDFTLNDEKVACEPTMPEPEVGDVRQIIDDVDEEKEGKTPDPGGGNYVHVNDAPGEENMEESKHRKQPYNLDLDTGGQQTLLPPTFNTYGLLIAISCLLFR